jgi:DNA (cytosine-5)-methyltransferase 1
VKIRVVDLLCGAGGMSEGLIKAAAALGLELELTGINHWTVAIDTQRRNHPYAQFRCTGLEAVHPREVAPHGHLHLLIAAPECIHHANARGGRPMNDQSRSSAWLVLRWLELLRVDHLLIENIVEFRDWGPLDAKNRPVASRKGELYRAFLAALVGHGYTVDERLLVAADYGAHTTRRRLFIQAKRGRGSIAWPEPTHSRAGHSTLLRHTQCWRAAAEIIDWSIAGTSVLHRPKPLSAHTLRQIREGMRRMGGRPFVIPQQSGGVPRSVEEPLPTIATAGAIALVQPFTLPYNSNGGALARPVTDPLGTITTVDRFALVVPQANGDALYRMLQRHELSAAMGFPRDYQFAGNKREQNKQVGNAVDVTLAEALCSTILERYADKRPKSWREEATA